MDLTIRETADGKVAISHNGVETLFTPGQTLGTVISAYKAAAQAGLEKDIIASIKHVVENTVNRNSAVNTGLINTDALSAELARILSEYRRGR